MSLKQVHQNLLKIKETSSTKAKTLLLAEMLKNDEFRLVITLMYDDFMHFKINKLPPKKITNGAFVDKPSNKELFNFLNKLSEQKGASNKDKQELSRLASMDSETYEVVKKIINKDAKCGFGGKTINKANRNLLFLMPYCRCSTAKNKMHNIDYKNGALGQEKADGMFVNVIIDKKGEVTFRSRNGNIIHQLEHLKKIINQAPKKYKNTVYMGELLIDVDGKVLPRQTGNGILNSCLQNAADHEMAKHAILKLWDAVPYDNFWEGKCKIKYKNRLTRTKHFSLACKGHPNNPVRILKSKLLYSLEDAQAFYKKLRQEGKEGAIVKNSYALWKDHTSPDQVKMKNVSDAELRIVSWKYGKEDTRFSDCMGSVQLESDDGLVKVSVSGFTDEERKLDWDARVGKIATLEYEGLINDKSRKDIYSLYLPQNLEMRPDRNDTDTLEDLKKR